MNDHVRDITKLLEKATDIVEDLGLELKENDKLVTRMEESRNFLRFRGYDEAADLMDALLGDNEEESRYWMCLEDKFPVKIN